ncbi:MAG: histidine phosphatase family protein [Ginsengibacter sp.]
MKSLLLIRHAKSSWGDVTLPDFERPLNERGKNDAPEMARRLKNKKIIIDAFISSPAKRAKKTAELFIEEFGLKKKEIILIPALYEASVEAFYRAILAVDNTLNRIAVFSHNPGITSFANELIKDVQLDNMPTCSIFAVRSNIKNWSDLKDAQKEFWFFDYPKKVE